MRGCKPSEVQTDTRAVAAVQAAPGWLSKEAKAEWRRVMPLLVERRILTDADLGSLENYCLCVGQVRATQAVIASEGLTITTKNGLRAHPAVRIQSDAMTRARLLAAELGLTPVSRSRVAIREDDNDPDSSDLGL
jgi:P27 family predicted phage terminase small subunit